MRNFQDPQYKKRRKDIYTMPCSTTVVQDAVYIEVVGSNPTGAAQQDCLT